MTYYQQAKVNNARYWNHLGVQRKKRGDEGAERCFELARKVMAEARV
jgi:hypothetical protein